MDGFRALDKSVEFVRGAIHRSQGCLGTGRSQPGSGRDGAGTIETANTDEPGDANRPVIGDSAARECGAPLATARPGKSSGATSAIVDAASGAPFGKGTTQILSI